MTVFKMKAKEAGIEFYEWGVGARDQVGIYLLGQMVALGLIDIGESIQKFGYKREYRDITLSAEVRGIISQVTEHLAETTPMYGPCVEPPLPWTSLYDGGFFTTKMRRACGPVVKCSPSARARVRNAPMPVVYAAINALQETAWAVNRPILQVVLDLHAAGVEVGEIISPKDPPPPYREPWLDQIEAKDMTPEQAHVFKLWKRAMTDWYEERKLRSVRFGRFYTASRQATRYKDNPALYFVHFADSRGRLYPMTYGISPQGSDLQKALIHFAEGLPLNTDDAVKWFLIQGANKWGYDKATLEKRQHWVREHAEHIMLYASAPLDNLGWTKADNPLQFLAWCFEFKQWQDNPKDFVSRIPVSMDGSCNGLQNFSAMLRDEVGGYATNLTPNMEMEDIYGRVAERAFIRLSALPDSTGMKSRWLSHGINRDLVKRSVMTTPYGVTHRSAVQYVVLDYLMAGKAPEFERAEYRKAAEFVMKAVWPAIGDVVVKAVEAMAWLRHAGKAISEAVAHSPDPVVEWVTPSGFAASQAYFDMRLHRIRTLLQGIQRIRVVTETDEPDISRHGQGLAPNFVHSMDASHLHLVTARAAAEGIKAFSMIHDDYGTHASNAQRLFHIIREEFLKMYEQHDPLQELRDRYAFLPEPPSKGTLDLSQVLLSEFFFS
jgi:DNA-directed RNA polymerase